MKRFIRSVLFIHLSLILCLSGCRVTDVASSDQSTSSIYLGTDSIESDLTENSHNTSSQAESTSDAATSAFSHSTQTSAIQDTSSDNSQLVSAKTETFIEK